MDRLAVVENDGVQADLKQILIGIDLGDLIVVFVKAQTLGTLLDDEGFGYICGLSPISTGAVWPVSLASLVILPTILAPHPFHEVLIKTVRD